MDAHGEAGEGGGGGEYILVPIALFAPLSRQGLGNRPCWLKGAKKGYGDENGGNI